jgi:hypothetical protein
MHKIKTNVNAFDTNQYPQVWFKTHYLITKSMYQQLLEPLAKFGPLAF